MKSGSMPLNINNKSESNKRGCYHFEITWAQVEIVCHLSSSLILFQFCFIGYPPEVCLQGLEFKCANGRCVSLELVCDDFDDCGDQTDERGCRKY